MKDARIGTDPSVRHEVFAEYVLPALDVLYRVACALTSQPADAEDLVQETLRAFRALPGAEVLNVPVGTVMSRPHRARNQLRCQVAAEGHTLPRGGFR